MVRSVPTKKTPPCERAVSWSALSQASGKEKIRQHESSRDKECMQIVTKKLFFNKQGNDEVIFLEENFLPSQCGHRAGGSQSSISARYVGMWYSTRQILSNVSFVTNAY